MSMFRTLINMCLGKVQVAGRRVAADGALVIYETDGYIQLDGTTGTTRAATFATTSVARSTLGGQRFQIRLAAASGSGAYTVACTAVGTAGTCTLDAANEAPVFQYIGSVLHLVELNGATWA